MSLESGGPSTSSGKTPVQSRPASRGATGSATTSGIAAAEAGQLPWSLPNPISRLTLLPGSSQNQLVIMGGITASGASAAGVYTLDTINGHLTQSASLVGPSHDASGVAMDGRYILFGGGTSAGSLAVVQSLLVSSHHSGSPAGRAPSLVATVIGQLPQLRSDSSAVLVGSTAYVVGGYNGTSADRSVLAAKPSATGSTITFHTVATLPIGVRYAAVAALGSRIYVFGGLGVSGADAGKPLSAIQQVDPTTGKASVVGTLPEPLYGAAAGNLGGVIYVAGGMTTSAGRLAGALHPIATVWAYDASNGRLLQAGQLRVPVAHAGVTVLAGRMWLIGGKSTGGIPIGAAQMVEPNRTFGTAGTPGAGSPYFGNKLLVADEGNDRLVLLSDTSKIIWTYPSATAPSPPGGFSADDAFFARHGHMIVTNEETKDVLAEVGFPSGKILWTYGHFGVPGSKPGYLNTPDDAYLLPDGNVITADIANCRVIVINPKTDHIVTQIGTTGRCIHDMDKPVALGSPNGDTPLPNGNILVSEINGSYVDEFTPQGKALWSVHLPISYPSDPQQIGPNRYLIAGYTKPGSLLEFNRQGQVLFRYQPTSGPGMLDHPSLVEMLPNGILMLNDDYNDRMIAIDPVTGALVWQYGVTHTPGSAPGMLSEPDGFDILAPGGLTPTHTGTG
ncbi:MAG: hypothetical protein M1115_05240 [Actinobacteria bacterium]|nr:hypothetical protein [Actinomycetota bacterium]